MLPMMRRKSMLPGFVDDFFGKDLLADFFEKDRGITMPAVNIVESGDDFRIEVAAPGLDKKDFNINIENNVLTISSQKEFKQEDENDKYVRREFSYTSFSRSFTLPISVDTDKISAKHKDGVLHVIIPKRDEVKQKPAKEIKIS
jgi:HSP20 family protein